NLRLNLPLVLELRSLGLPMIVALNMIDLANKRGYRIDRARLEKELGIPVVETVAVRASGHRALVERVDAHLAGHRPPAAPLQLKQYDAGDLQREARRILTAIDYKEPARHALLSRLDAAVMHP